MNELAATALTRIVGGIEKTDSAKISHGPFYLPHLSGERSPFMDANARASFIGLGPETDRAALCLAVFEGVAFGVRSLKEHLEER